MVMGWVAFSEVWVENQECLPGISTNEYGSTGIVLITVSGIKVWVAAVSQKLKTSGCNVLIQFF